MEILALILEIIPMVIAAASAVAALTPTPKDDKLVGKLYKFLIEIPALNVGRAKDPNRKKPMWGYDEGND